MRKEGAFLSVPISFSSLLLSSTFHTFVSLSSGFLLFSPTTVLMSNCNAAICINITTNNNKLYNNRTHTHKKKKDNLTLLIFQDITISHYSIFLLHQTSIFIYVRDFVSFIITIAAPFSTTQLFFKCVKFFTNIESAFFLPFSHDSLKTNKRVFTGKTHINLPLTLLYFSSLPPLLYLIDLFSLYIYIFSAVKEKENKS